jgi:hypothetical protein
MNGPRFAIVGHPNKGKSSIVATLAEDESVAIGPDPGTTAEARVYPMRRDGQTLYELIDTPGFQRAREVLGWLRQHDRGAGARADVVAEFVRAHASDSRFHDECTLLRPIIDGAGILYVVDGSRPYGAEYEAEMEVLRWTGRPRMALINLIGSGDHVEQWRTALGQFFSIVRVFDAVRASFEARIELLRAFGAIDEAGAAQLNRAADVLTAEHTARRRRCAEAIADLLCAALTSVATAALPGQTSDAAIEEKVRERLRSSVRKEELRERIAVQEIYHHEGTRSDEAAAELLLTDVFSARSFSVFGLSATQLALTGAASGAVAGGMVDAMLGGASLLLGAGIGALIGGLSTLAGADRLAKVEVLGQPLGGFELTIGPITDPNFPWVLLGRALLHARLIAERNHAHREALVIDAERGKHFSDEIDPAARRRLDGLFRKIRGEQAVAPAQRQQLIDEIATLLAPPGS